LNNIFSEKLKINKFLEDKDEKEFTMKLGNKRPDLVERNNEMEDLESLFDKVSNPIHKFDSLIKEDKEVEKFTFDETTSDSGSSTPSSMDSMRNKRNSKRNSSNSPLVIVPVTRHQKRRGLKSTRKISDYKNLSSYRLTQNDRAILEAVNAEKQRKLKEQLKATGHTMQSYKEIFTVTDEQREENKKEAKRNFLLISWFRPGLLKGVVSTKPIVYDETLLNDYIKELKKTKK
jgi:hypothetical protein